MDKNSTTSFASFDSVPADDPGVYVTRVTLQGGVCPCCARRFKAPAPEGLEPGSPFGPNLRAFVIYLRSVQGIPMARLSDVLKDLFDLDISEGALVNILAAARKPFAAQTNLIKRVCCRGRRWRPTKPGRAWARPIGGSGCSITATAPPSWPRPAAPRQSSRRSWATGGRTSGCRTGWAARSAGLGASISSASRI